jgi:wyosine [tRNA(Phe)-imidazoG37] synthetase (radical SAM superfamily)
MNHPATAVPEEATGHTPAKPMDPSAKSDCRDAARGARTVTPQNAFGYPRDFLDNRFVYITVSPRARGLAVGVNMNPDKRCNLKCVYCEVDRSTPGREQRLDVAAAAAELQRTLALVHSGQLQVRPLYSALPNELLTLRHVALSGDGEPTLCPNFAEALESVVHVRALGKHPFFKIVLITNAVGLDAPGVQESLRFLTRQDEIWAKLDVGTQDHFDALNRPEPGVTLDRVLENILMVGRQRSIVIQSMFPVVAGKEPTVGETGQYALRLKELKQAGAQIALVQIYSATRPVASPECTHLPLKALSRIAQVVRLETGLTVEVF